MHARLVRGSRRLASLSGRDRVTRIIIGVLVVLVVAGFAPAALGEPDWQPPVDPVLGCIEECAVQYPDLGEDYDACVAACYE